MPWRSFVVGSCFFEMREKYIFPSVDMPWAYTTVNLGAHSRTVKHELGTSKKPVVAEGFCMPRAALEEIEARIDVTAETQRWIGNGGTKRKR